MKNKAENCKAKKRILTMFLCAALMLNGGMSVLADTGEGNNGSDNGGNHSINGTVTPGDVSDGNVIAGALEVNAVINDKSDNNDHTFELELEAWVAGTLEKETALVKTSSQLDATTVLRSQITDYFDYDCTCEGEEHTCITIYTSSWDGSKFLDAVQIYPVTDGESGEEDIAVTFDGKTMEITGFSYKDHPVAQEDTTGIGQKLIVKIPVETAVGFWGGNNVPVMDSSTAIYQNGQAEKAFPIPEANVPLSVKVDAQDKTIYYGGEISGGDLLSSVTAGYQTAGATDGTGNVAVNLDGTFTPAAEWMDDYAVITWITYADQGWAGVSLPADGVSKVCTEDYAFTVNMSPLLEGSDNSNHPGVNAEGGTIAGTPVVKEGISVSDTGRAYVLIPVITFKDTTIYRGFIPDQDYFKTYNMESVEWMEMTGCSLEATVDEDSYTYPAADPTTEPELIFTYTPEYLDYITDTKVSVAVESSNDNDAESIYVSNVAIFGGVVNACAEGERNQFHILVAYKAPFELPATGGEGTLGYTLTGTLLLMGAAMLLYKKKQYRI